MLLSTLVVHLSPESPGHGLKRSLADSECTLGTPLRERYDRYVRANGAVEDP
jgi:hypothetical protein